MVNEEEKLIGMVFRKQIKGDVEGKKQEEGGGRFDLGDWSLCLDPLVASHLGLLNLFYGNWADVNVLFFSCPS